MTDFAATDQTRPWRRIDSGVDAVRVAEQACDTLACAIKWDTLGFAYYQLGDLQRLRGEFAKAEESYCKASEAGREPEAGLALLRVAQGRQGHRPDLPQRPAGLLPG